MSSISLTSGSIWDYINLSKIETLHTGIISSAKIYEGLETAWSFAPLRDAVPSNWHTGIVNFYISLNPTLQVFKTLAIIGVINNIPKIIKRSYQFVHSNDLDRFDAAMRALRAVSAMFQNIAYFLYGIDGLHCATKLEELSFEACPTAVKTATSFANTFLALSTLLSITDTVIHARKLRKTEEFIDRFNVYYKPNGFYHRENYENFRNFLNGTEDCELKSYFQVDGELLRAKLMQFFSVKDLDYIHLRNMTRIMKKLHGRLESTKTTYRVCLIADAANILSMALIISGLFHPLGFVLLGICTLGRLLAYAQRKISAYSFENKIGLIAREESSYGLNSLFVETSQSPVGVMTRIKDFGKWFFGCYDHVSIPNVAAI